MEKSKKKASLFWFAQRDYHLHSSHPSAGSSYAIWAHNQCKSPAMQDLPTHALASPPPAHTRIDSKGASSSYHGIRACNKGKCLDMHDTQAIIHAPPSLGPFRLNEVCPNGFMYENPFGAHLSGSRSLGLNLETVKTYSDADFGSSIPSGFGGGHSPGSELSPSTPVPLRFPFFLVLTFNFSRWMLVLLLETMVEPLLASHQVIHL
ncbi:hypothetical protein NC652_035156 [Populus alba x Populus x berolinensis]|nr:hypothetical protein NC652_035156 [Populus alba x Populus x berolinensis]